MKKQLEVVFAPVIGRLVWNVHRGEGRYLTMEFGKPHLRVREPFSLKSETSKRVQRFSRMRGAFVYGDWSLFIQGDWKVAVEDDWLAILSRDMPVYDAAASERHFEAMLALFGETLKA